MIGLCESPRPSWAVRTIANHSEEGTPLGPPHRRALQWGGFALDGAFVGVLEVRQVRGVEASRVEIHFAKPDPGDGLLAVNRGEVHRPVVDTCDREGVDRTQDENCCVGGAPWPGPETDS
jgi:hypothetical protein